jgi:hypothetical protein
VGGTPYTLGQDTAQGGLFEPSAVFNGGAYRPGYLVGKCTMADGTTALAAASVDLFLTSTNQFVSSGQTDPNGNYMLPTPFLAQNHYIYANYSNSTFVGASANTLLPNF